MPKVYFGSRGGAYTMKNGNKFYLSRFGPDPSTPRPASREMEIYGHGSHNMNNLFDSLPEDVANEYALENLNLFRKSREGWLFMDYAKGATSYGMLGSIASIWFRTEEPTYSDVTKWKIFFRWLVTNEYPTDEYGTINPSLLTILSGVKVWSPPRPNTPPNTPLRFGARPYTTTEKLYSLEPAHIKKAFVNAMAGSLNLANHDAVWAAYTAWLQGQQPFLRRQNARVNVFPR